MPRLFSFLFPVVSALLLCQCETTSSGGGNSSPAVVREVTGTLHYPDEANHKFILRSGAKIIGAGGANCTYVIESGASLTAHSGTNNTYLVKSGGKFRGFAHPATNCSVKYEADSIIEQEQAGEGTTFAPLY